MNGLPRWIAKRDGPDERFDSAKLGGSIARAGVDVNVRDIRLARELASVVSLFISQQMAGRQLSSIQLQSMTEQVLTETGHSNIAMSYTLYHQRRHRLREQLRVEDHQGQPSVWNKTRIACHLSGHHHLGPSTGRMIASMVEKRVMAAGFERITQRLIREIVNNELLGWGLSPLDTNAGTTAGKP